MRKSGLVWAASAVFGVAGLAWAASFNAVKSGPWTDPATWGTTGCPTNSDDQVSIQNPHTVHLTADTSVDYVNLGHGGGTLDMRGYKLVLRELHMQNNGSGRVLRSGEETITASDLIMTAEGSELTLVAGDRCKRLQAGSGGVITTAVTSNVADSVLFDGGTINLGADLDVTGWVNGGRGSGVLNMNGHNVRCEDFVLQNWGGATVTRLGEETITASDEIRTGEGSSLVLVAGDRCRRLIAGGGGGEITTIVTSNVTEYASADSTLNLGADLDVTGTVQLGAGVGIIHMNGHSIRCDMLFLQNWGTGMTDGTGDIFVNRFHMGDGGSTGQAAGGSVRDSITFSGAKDTMRVIQPAGHVDGLSLDSTGGLTLNGLMDLHFDNTPSGGADWAFRWKGNHTNDIAAKVLSGNITWTAPSWMSITNWYDQASNYTYIGDPRVMERATVLTVR